MIREPCVSLSALTWPVNRRLMQALSVSFVTLWKGIIQGVNC